jgi:hypothetical protein
VRFINDNGILYRYVEITVFAGGFVAFVVTFMPLLSGHLGRVAVPVQEIGEL